MDELEKEKQEKIKKQIMREKESRDEQMRQNYIKKRIELLKEKKFEKSLVKTIQEGLEKDKKEALEKKKRENEALNKAIKENDRKNFLEKIRAKEQKNKGQQIDLYMKEVNFMLDDYENWFGRKNGRNVNRNKKKKIE